MPRRKRRERIRPERPLNWMNSSLLTLMIH
jgi:hypothetical protein